MIFLNSVSYIFWMRLKLLIAGGYETVGSLYSLAMHKLYSLEHVQEQGTSKSDLSLIPIFSHRKC